VGQPHLLLSVDIIDVPYYSSCDAKKSIIEGKNNIPNKHIEAMTLI
jgi:hypothetical protein